MADPWAEFRVGKSDTGDDPWAEFRDTRREQPNVVGDVAKQIGSGLVVGAETLPAAVPSALGWLGRGAEYLFGQGDPEAVAQRETMQRLIKENRGEGIAQYLPKPETTAGQYARSAAEMVPGMVAGTTLSVPRAAAVGATAGLGSEAAGQATEGTSYEPAARIGGALAGGLGAARLATPSAAVRAPTTQQLERAAGEAYGRARNLGVAIKPQAAGQLAGDLKTSLSQEGLDEIIAPKTWGILNKLENAPEGSVMTVQNFQTLRRTLGNAAGSADRSERLAAIQAKQELDAWLSNLPEGATIAGNPKQAAALLSEANANYAAAQRAQEVSRKVMRAELRAAAANSGQNVANSARQRFADILLTPSLRRGYSAEELQAMERIVRGGALENALRYTSNYLGGGGGLGQLATSALGGGAYMATDDPRWLLLPGLGIGARSASNRMTLRNAARLNELIRSRAPFAAQRSASPSLINMAAPAFLPFGYERRSP